jgi:hypothetical protein
MIAGRIGHRFSPDQPQHSIPPAARPTPSPSAILPYAPPAIGGSSFAHMPEGHE